MFVTLTVLVLMTAAPPQLAIATPEWCRDDPILIVEGRQAMISTTFAWSNLSSLTGPIAYEIVLPSNVQAKVVTPNDPWTPETAAITRTGETWSGSGPIPVTVRVLVSASASFPTTVSVSGGAVDGTYSASGTSNTTTTVSFPLGQ